MANSNFQTKKPSSLLLPITITFFLLLLNRVNSSEVLSFRFTKFGADQQNLILQGDALVTSTGKLQLTKVENGKPVSKSLGRALYATPVHIWDNTTGNVASFYTSFDFVMNATNPSTKADGLAFFIAPVDTKPGKNGGFLGLFNSENYDSSNQIVAVEFDTYYNGWDPKGAQPHIGIDVNTIKSKKTSSWGFKNGNVASILISYLAPSKTLVASLVYPSGKTSYILSAAVDLKSVVPQWARVGFSATTGVGDPNYVETHDILNWRFKSKLKSHSSSVEEDDMDITSFMQDDSMDEVALTSYL